nr:GNAT family N-acetyltransferase [Lachnospiraceae bacterium]
MLKLIEANLEDLEKEWEFVRDIPEDENGFTNPWHGVSREVFEQEALPGMLKDARGEDLPDWKVPETFYFLWDDDQIVGEFRIRHYLNEALKNGAGHIGYYIGKPYRGKGYATEGLKRTLEIARKIVPEEEIYLSVHKDNPASLRVQEKNGGYIVGEDEKEFFVRIEKYVDQKFRFIFVRHGEPDYRHDTLTEMGKLQAAAAAERLKDEGIEEIYASTMGRAYETAAYTAEKIRKPITKLEFMREIGWGGENLRDGGHPWTLGAHMIDHENYDFFNGDWKKHPDFAGNKALECYEKIGKEIDRLLEKEGFIHEGNRFLCKATRSKTIALFSHGGSGACALSHILGMPFPYVCTVMPYEFTSVTILEFPVKPGFYVHPRLELFNDTAHMKGISSGL